MLWRHSSRNTMTLRKHWLLRMTYSRYNVYKFCICCCCCCCCFCYYLSSPSDFQALDDSANRLVSSSNYAAEDIDKRRKEVFSHFLFCVLSLTPSLVPLSSAVFISAHFHQVLDRKSDMVSLSASRKVLLDDSYKLQHFLRDVHEVKVWAVEKLKTAGDESFRVSRTTW